MDAEATRSRTLVSAMSRPRPMTTRWSAVSSSSLIRWLDTSTARPSAASDRRKPRIQRMPSGSSPLTGSSNRSIGASPSTAPAMPNRCSMPRESPPARRRAAGVSPTSSSTSSTRPPGMPLDWAIQSRWSRARRPGWTAVASSSAPTWRRGVRRVRYRQPPTSAVPSSGASRPRMMRSVVDLPAPLGPTKPVTWPPRTVKDRSSTAVVRPYRLCTPRTSMVASMAATIGTHPPLSSRPGVVRISPEGDLAGVVSLPRGMP